LRAGKAAHVFHAAASREGDGPALACDLVVEALVRRQAIASNRGCRQQHDYGVPREADHDGAGLHLVAVTDAMIRRKFRNVICWLLDAL
jgi:hypothetical protein